MLALHAGLAVHASVALQFVVSLNAALGQASAHPSNTDVIAPQPYKSPILVPLRREMVPVKRKGAIVSHKTSYSGMINVGHPAQEFRVVFDTGSGHVVLPSTECKSRTCLAHRRYSMMESSSAAPINLDGTPALDGEMSDQVTIGYGTGQVVGEFVRDEVCIGGVGRSGETTQVEPLQSCQNLQVVVAVEMSKQPFKNFLFDGIFGLGLGSLALSKNFSFFNTFVQQGGFGSPHFSVFLTDSEAGDESEIAFGGYNPERLSGSLSWAPVVKPDMGYWQLELLAVRVDGQPLDVCKDGSCRAVIDTGTSHLGIPSPHDEVLSDLLIRPAIGVSDCRYVKAPILEFEFPNAKIILHPEDYMRKLPLAQDIQVGSIHGVSLDKESKSATRANSRRSPPGPAIPSQTEHSYECRPRLMPMNLPAPMGPKLFILGEPVLHRYYTVFDWEGPQIGFGLANKNRLTDSPDMVSEPAPEALILLQVGFVLNQRTMNSGQKKVV